MSQEKHYCPYSDPHITGSYEPEVVDYINMGYDPCDISVLMRYYLMTGCQRQHAARHHLDECGLPGYHLMDRKYERKREKVLGVYYKEILESGLHEGFKARRMIFPTDISGLPDIGIASNFDMIMDYEPERNSDGSLPSHEGKFHAIALFDLKSGISGKVHPSKLVLRYDPWTKAYTSMTMTIYNVDSNGKSTGFHTKLDYSLGNYDNCVKGRIQIDRKESAPDTVGPPIVSIVPISVKVNFTEGLLRVISNATYYETDEHELRSRTPVTELSYSSKDFSEFVVTRDYGNRRNIYGIPILGNGITTIKIDQGDNYMLSLSANGQMLSLPYMLNSLTLPPIVSDQINDTDVMVVFNHMIPLFRNLVQTFQFSDEIIGA